MDKHLGKLLKNQLYEIIPSNLVVIDREYNIVQANKAFENQFGETKGKKCYEVYKKKDSPCSHCRVNEVFETGKTIVSNEDGIDKNHNQCFYAVHLAPLKEEDGSVNYVVEMSFDVTDSTRYQQNYNILFERVPGFISIIDKNYKIVRANKKLRDTFGEVKGKYCYEVYKKRTKKCRNCPAALTFKDGKDHVSSETGKSDTGVDTQYFVTTTPLSPGNGDTNMVIEIATDITELIQLHKEVRLINDFFATLIQNSHSGILAINNHGKTEIFNPSAKDMFDWQSFKKPVLNQIKKMMPEEFFGKADSDGMIIDIDEISVKGSSNEDIPVSMKAVELKSKKDVLGRVAFMRDLRPIKELEKQKIDAERLAAVGQTVAGLAHTIKNLLMGLEGGMYMVDTGLRNGDAQRIVEGWDVLQRNFSKTTTLVKDFLAFSKGKLPELQKISPNTLVNDIVELYFDAAKKQGVELKIIEGTNPQEAYLDPDGMEACLTNIVSNAIDAAVSSNEEKGVVTVKTFDDDDKLIFEVEDNGIGMDTEVRDKIFTTFFTTKGGNGTGLGLLTTRKILSEHGGKIEFDTEKDKGSTFRIILDRHRLEAINKELSKINK